MYLIGGAEATGNVNDTAVVYTPAFHEYDDKGQRRVYVWNMTLPLNFFSRAPMNLSEGGPTLIATVSVPLLLHQSLSES